MALEFPDWKGIMRQAEDDLPVTVAASSDGKTIVWSKLRGEDVYQVRYCLQVRRFTRHSEAGREFSNCLLHKLICEEELFPDPSCVF